MTLTILQTGTFTLGCNYWASHAGTRMWTDWRPEIVERDFAVLAAAGLTTLRVFPLWSDFQPVIGQYGGRNALRNLALQPVGGQEQPLPDTPAGRAGLDPVMLDRFEAFCAIAERHGLGLIVGLITGWMSGRTFCPPVLAGRNLHSDPLALQLQGRFIRVFVERFRTRSAVVAWDLGNECNCFGPAASTESAWAWTAFVTQAIRCADPSRPVVSGMHSLEPTGQWTIQDQAEHCDVLTTHPYPLWSRHTSQDPLDTVRTTLHATAETRMYADIGGKPCFAEEIGTMGPMMGDWEAAARFVRVNLFSLWANDCRGFQWWCAFDQRRLTHAPYDWVGVERELGLFDEDHRPKPMLNELTRFSTLLKQLPSPLPTRRIDAVCVLTRGQDAWGVAYGAWILATQARMSLRFAWADEPLPEAQRYLLPSLSGIESITARRWHELLARVEAGADLLVTLGDGVVEPFTEVFGVAVTSRSQRRGATTFTLDGASLQANHGPDLVLRALPGTTVRGADAAGRPMLTERAYGSGRVMLAAYPVEAQLTGTVGGVHGPAAEPHYAIYRAWTAGLKRPLDCTERHVAITCHGRHVVVVNHDATPAEVRCAPGVRVARWLHGGPIVAGHDAAVAELAE